MNTLVSSPKYPLPSNLHTTVYCHKNSKINKNHYWAASRIDCFELILGFRMQFWFQNIGMRPGIPKDFDFNIFLFALFTSVIVFEERLKIQINQNF